MPKRISNQTKIVLLTTAEAKALAKGELNLVIQRLPRRPSPLALLRAVTRPPRAAVPPR